MHSRAQELISQKGFLTRRLKELEAVQADVQSLTRAMTGDLQFGKKISDPQSRRVSMRGAAIAVMAFNRFQRAGDECGGSTFGLSSDIRGEIVSVLTPSTIENLRNGMDAMDNEDDERESNRDTDSGVECVPEVDESSTEKTLRSVSRLLYHFSGGANQTYSSSILSSSSIVHTVSRTTAGGTPSADKSTSSLAFAKSGRSQVALLRKIALALSSRIRELEEEKEILANQVVSLQADVDQLRHAQERFAESDEHTQELIAKLQTRVKELMSRTSSMVELEDLEAAEKEKRELQRSLAQASEESRETRQIVSELRSQVVNLEKSARHKLQAIQSLQQSNRELSEELDVLRVCC